MIKTAWCLWAEAIGIFLSKSPLIPAFALSFQHNRCIQQHPFPCPGAGSAVLMAALWDAC